MQSPFMFIVFEFYWGFQWLSQRSLLVNVTLHLKICRLFSNIFWYWFFFFFYFTILYWFCHTSTGIRHGCTCIPHPEPPSHFLSYTILFSFPSLLSPFPLSFLVFLLIRSVMWMGCLKVELPFLQPQVARSHQAGQRKKEEALLLL